MFCGNCGTSITDDAKFCPKCGNPVRAEFSKEESVKDETVITGSPEIIVSTKSTNRVRHGFTSFWLITGIVTCAITGIIYLVAQEMIYNSTGMSYGQIQILGGVMIAEVIGCVLLLYWKKVGFWLIVGVCIINLVVSFTSGVNIIQIIFALIGIISFWAILQIPKNGKTTWQQLE